MTYTNLPRWVNWTLGVFFIAVAATATALSFAMNVDYGLQINAAVAVISGLADVALAGLSVGIAVFGWSPIRRAAFIACAVWSVFTAANFMADELANRHAGLEHDQTQFAQLQREKSDIRAALANIGTTPAVKPHADREAAKREAIASEAARGGCGPQCRALQDDLQAILDAKAKAVKAETERLRGELLHIDAALAGGPPSTPSGLALVASSWSGTEETLIREGMLIFTLIAALILLELSRHLVWTGFAAIGAVARPVEVAKPAQVSRVALTPRERSNRALRSLVG